MARHGRGEDAAQRVVERLEEASALHKSGKSRTGLGVQGTRGAVGAGRAALHGQVNRIGRKANHEMNIIIVASPLSTPRVLRLGNWRSVAAACVTLVVVAGVLIGSGALFGATFGGPSKARAEIAQAREQLEAQRSQLGEVQHAMARDMDALAVRLGKLQAESMRLNALGERLAKVGKLDDGEFDFRSEPGLGGPAPATSAISLSVTEVDSTLERLEAQFARQSDQLGMLESVLFDREVDQGLMPAGIPVRSGYKSSGFGYRADPFTGRPDFHPGVDFNGPRGSDVIAVAGGVVSYSGLRPGYGNVVEIDHGNGYMTRYAHNDRNLVEVGDPVRVGGLLARMGSTGRATGVHVHFEVWLNGRLVNPSEYIRAIR
jgi:murein DD-endopeptidase MepM/ murein hydrolase activator NlpD